MGTWKTSARGNADALSRLPMGEDTHFDREEEATDASIVCTIQMVSRQLNPTDAGLLAKESSKDSIQGRIQRGFHGFRGTPLSRRSSSCYI